MVDGQYMHGQCVDGFVDHWWICHFEGLHSLKLTCRVKSWNFIYIYIYIHIPLWKRTKASKLCLTIRSHNPKTNLMSMSHISVVDQKNAQLFQVFHVTFLSKTTTTNWWGPKKLTLGYFLKEPTKRNQQRGCYASTKLMNFHRKCSPNLNSIKKNIGKWENVFFSKA